MKKIGDVTSTADKNGEHTNGNVAAGIAPTILEADWLNSVQREILGVIIAAGLKQDKNNDNQLVEAIKKIISNWNYATPEDLKKYLAKDQNGADIQDKPKFIENLGLKEIYFPLTGGDIDGGITASGAIKSKGRLSVENPNGFSGLDLIGDSYDVVIDTNGKGVPYVAIRDKASGNTYQVALPLKSGTAALLSDIAKNTADKSASGWWKCADTGVIFQWGVVTRTGRKTHVNYPIPFPSACRAVTATLCNNIDQATTSTANIRTTSITRTGFDYESNDWQEGEASWIAMGY